MSETTSATQAAPTITIRRTLDREGYPIYIASAGQGAQDLLARGAEEQARVDGLAYYLRTRHGQVPQTTQSAEEASS